MKNKTIKSYITALLTILCISAFAQEGEITISQDDGIQKLLEYKKDIKRTAEIYKIQVFQSNDPDRANSIKVGFLKKFNSWPVDIVWNTPNYKIWVGNFRSQLEADRALKRIKTKYMNAFIFKPKKDKN